MDQRISIVTLGTDDLPRAVAFWEAMGWPRKARKFDAIAMFQCGGMVLAIYPFDKLAEDCGMADRGPGFGGFTLAHNVSSKAEVDALLARAVANGATLQKPAHDAFWGGYSGIVGPILLILLIGTIILALVDTFVYDIIPN